ncbi:TniQ family protein [Streptomyces sp. NPDC015127]|uniref:TniQ family protein n=1 Tax=Streptomyces sp. NPDC015127 TaxID=3364939 RepID=UPI0036F83B56
MDGESLASWVNAMSRQSGMDTTALLRELRLSREGSLNLLQVRLPESAVRHLRRETGLDEEALHAMTLARFSGTALPHLPVEPWQDAAAFSQWHSSAWLSDRRARWCPKCLRENDMRWPLRWMLPWSFACLKHSLYLATECARCLSPVYFNKHSALRRSCSAYMREHTYAYDATCGFPITQQRNLRVSDPSILILQQRINAWLDGQATTSDRQFASLTAVMVLLVTLMMMRHHGEDPALLCGLRSRPGQGTVHEWRLWEDPLRVAAAASVAHQILRSATSPADVATTIQDLRTVDHREYPCQLDVMDWAYGPALRPNLYVDELVRRGVITIGAFRRV